jgi:hypothetical protein
VREHITKMYPQSGFLQALTGLDVADDRRDATGQIIHSLLQGLLGSPDFETYSNEDLSYPYGMILYYVRVQSCSSKRRAN